MRLRWLIHRYWHRRRWLVWDEDARTLRRLTLDDVRRYRERVLSELSS